MMGHTHQIGAITAAAYISPIILGQTPHISGGVDIYLPTAVLLLCSMAGGLLPDADTPHSTLGIKLLPVLWPMYLMQSILSLLSRFIKPLRKVSRILGHRGISHTLVPYFILSIFFTASCIAKLRYMTIITSGIMIGALSHLFLDYLSGGIPLGFPFSLERVKPPIIRIKTGGILEYLFGIILLALLYKAGTLFIL